MMASKRTVSGKSKKTTGKKAAHKRAYSQQTGKLTGREVSAQARLEKLTAKYVAEGMSASEARNVAREVMRANPRRDWRNG
jgi:hypothetical protein